MKNKGLYLGIFVSILLISFVSATPLDDIKNLLGLNGSENIFVDLMNKILGESPSGLVGGQTVSFVFARFLFLVIIFVIVWAAVKRMSFLSESWMAVSISIAVALLAVRFLLEVSWITTIILPYTVFGIAVTSILPLVLYFYFVEEGINSKTIRKIAWALAAVVFAGLWWSRYDEIKQAAWVYPAAALLSLLLIFLDRPIQETKEKIKGEKRGKQQFYAIENEFTKEFKALHEALANAPDGAKRKEIEGVIREKEKALKAVRKSMGVS